MVKIDLGLARLLRRCTKVVMLITAKTATTPPITPPTIGPMFFFRFPFDDEFDGEFELPGNPSALMVFGGALRKYLSQERKKNRGSALHELHS
jgi:hypothetical protein